MEWCFRPTTANSHGLDADLLGHTPLLHLSFNANTSFVLEIPCFYFNVIVFLLRSFFAS